MFLEFYYGDDPLSEFYYCKLKEDIILYDYFRFPPQQFGDQLLWVNLSFIPIVPRIK